MIRRRLALSALALALGWTPQAAALIAGGGNKKSDCYAEWEVNSPDVVANKGKVGFQCTDGEACDTDGQPDGTCTFKVAVCVNQTLAGCTVQPLTSIDNLTPPVVAPTDLTTANCGSLTDVPVPVKHKRNGKLGPGKLKLKMVAVSSGKPKKDPDKLMLTCLPGQTVTTTTQPQAACTPLPANTTSSCPTNAAGGPRELKLTIVPNGTGGDLDNGWNGGSHNFPIGGGAVLDFCLSGCDSGANPVCTGTGATGGSTTNGLTFGSPLPLLAATPVCVINRFDDSIGHITLDSANYKTNEMTAGVNLLSDVYLTAATQVCPQCSGSAVGQSGVCRGGRNDGRSCTVTGTAFVADAPSNDKNFELSSDCPPGGSPAATLHIGLVPLTSGMAIKTGSKPCPGQAQDDGCTGGGTCTGTCSDVAARRGGIAQVCCSNQPNLPCFPSGSQGQIERDGKVDVVTTPTDSFPACGKVTLASVFCEAATGVSAIDTVAAGLPGPGALIMPMTVDWIK